MCRAVFCWWLGDRKVEWCVEDQFLSLPELSHESQSWAFMEFFVSLVFREQNNSPIHWKKWQPPRHSQTSIFSSWTLPSTKVSRLFSFWWEASPATAGWGCVTSAWSRLGRATPLYLTWGLWALRKEKAWGAVWQVENQCHLLNSPSS